MTDQILAALKRDLALIFATNPDARPNASWWAQTYLGTPTKEDVETVQQAINLARLEVRVDG